MAKRPGLRRAIWGVILSLVAPGLGQVYVRSWRAGILLLIITTVLSLIVRVITQSTPTALGFSAVSLIILVNFGLVIGTAYSAFRGLRGETLNRESWAKSTWFAAIVYFIVGLTIDYVFPIGWQSFNDPSSSMVPTFLVGDRFIVDLQTAGDFLSRGDVVVFRLPRDQTSDYIKRIIGLPGDTIQLTNGQLIINGQQANRNDDGNYTDDSEGQSIVGRKFTETLPDGKSYSILKTTNDGFMNNTPVYTVPSGDLFVMGDSRDNSLDSRVLDDVGYIPIQNVIGKASFIYFSIDRKYPWFEFWEWPFEIRWDRALTPVA